MVSTNFNPINDIILAVVFVGGIIVYAKSRIPRQTIKDLQAHAAAQDLTIQDLRESKEQLIKAMGILEGQVKVYKELPLRELAEGIKDVSATNKKILDVLQNTAKINAQDRDVLTNQSKHIRAEVSRLVGKKK